MNIILIFGLLIVFGAVGYILWDKRKESKKYEKIIVSYSEKVGNNIIEHEKQYIGVIDLKEDIFKIPAINQILPNPPSNVYVTTKGGNKKVYIIKLDSFRLGYRIPSTNNEVYIQKRDKNGNGIKSKKGKPVLVKHCWKYCDDVVEPDVKHWQENILEKLKIKHRTRQDMLNKWIGAIVLGVILIGGIIVVHMTTKYAGEQLKEMRTLSTETAEKVEKSSGLLSNLIKKVEERQNPGGG